MANLSPIVMMGIIYFHSMAALLDISMKVRCLVSMENILDGLKMAGFETVTAGVRFFLKLQQGGQ